MSRRHHVRGQSRRSPMWRVFYGGKELAGEGTVLDMNETGYRIAGCMPVDRGMRLRLCIWPSQKPDDIVVVQGTVKWAKGLQFGLAAEPANAENQHEVFRAISSPVERGEPT